MWYWLICLALLCESLGCSAITHWRQRNTLAQMDRIFAEGAAKRSPGGPLNWGETVRCGNDGARRILAQRRSPYVDLVEAAFAPRLAIAQQVNAGVISAKEGQARPAAIDAQIRLLPGSMMELLKQMAERSRSARTTTHE